LIGIKLPPSAPALIVSIQLLLTLVHVPLDSVISHSTPLCRELQITNIHGELFSLMKMVL
jgi:hypothetical protein